MAQLSLPGIDPPAARMPRRRPRPDTGPAKVPPADDPLLAAFRRRLMAQGRAAKGRAAYRYQMRPMLVLASRRVGRAISCADLFRDEVLLGHVLVDEVAPTLGTRLSKWTMVQRRSAARDFVKLMRPELLPLLGEEPHDLLDGALRGTPNALVRGIGSMAVLLGDVVVVCPQQARSATCLMPSPQLQATSVFATAPSS